MKWKENPFLNKYFWGNYWYIYISSVKLVSYIYLRCNKKKKKNKNKKKKNFHFSEKESKTLFITQNQFFQFPPPVKKKELRQFGFCVTI